MKQKAPSASYISGGRRRPLFINTRHVAFRRQGGRTRAPASWSQARRIAEHRNKGIALYEIPEGIDPTTARQNLVRALAAKDFDELPCYSSASAKWMVPTDLIIVQFKPNATPAQITALFSDNAVVKVEQRKRRTKQYLVQVSSPADAITIARRWCDVDYVSWAQVNWLREARKKLIPNDARFDEQWYLHNTGQGGGLPNRDVYAERAWDITTGHPSVVIAILDDGFDLLHPDLMANVFSNAAEIFNGQDSDTNEYIDDVFGWDFVDNTNDVSPKGDTDNHGTVSAGFACAVGNNGAEIASLAYGCRFLPLRVAGEGLVGDIDWINSMDYAASLADVISIGYFIDPTPGNLQALRNALVTGRDGLGCVVVAALGNDGVLRRYSSDAAAAPEVISVSAVSNYDRKSWFADYGPAVDVVAPGGGGSFALLTTDRIGSNGYDSTSYCLADGTSASAPITAGLAALMVAQHPTWSGLEVRQAIEASCDRIDSVAHPYDTNGWNDYYGFGRINAWKALTMAQPEWDTYEPDNGTNTATAIADGELQYRSLGTDDVDWVSFTILSTTDLRLSVLGTTNTQLYLYNDSGQEIGEEDTNSLPYSHLETNGLSSGTYYAKVENPDSVAIPFYGLHFGILNMPDQYEADNGTNEAATIVPRQMQFHTFYPTGDVDWATFDLSGSTKVDIWTMGDMDGDTVLFLRDVTGALITTNDDFNYPYSFYSHISTQLNAGKYYVEVRELNDDALPSYQLLLETYQQDADDPADTSTNTAVPISDGERIVHTLYTTNDVDWFTFELTNRSSVLVMTDSENPFLDQESRDTLLVLYKDNGGLVTLSTNADGNNIYFSAIYQPGLDTGRYYVEVRGQDLTNPCPNYSLALDVFEQKSAIDSLSVDTNGLEIGWSGNASFMYGVEETSDLTVTQSWSVVTNVEGFMGRNSWTDLRPLPVPVGGVTQRFYRIRVVD
jgi:subtilisin family serine protease